MINREFLFFSFLIWGGMAAGAVWRHWRPGVARWTRPLLQFDTLVCATTGLFISGWALEQGPNSWKLFSLPVIGGVVSGAGLLSAMLYSRRRRLKTAQAGAVLAAASVSNIGLTFGMPVCLAFFGLQGQALAGLYLFYFPFLIFIVLFTVMDRMRREAEGEDTSRESWGGLAIRFFRDPFRTLPILAYCLGFVLNNTAGPKAMPDFFRAINPFIIGLNLCTAFLAVGFTIHPGGLIRNIRSIAFLCGVKFLIGPAIGGSLAYLVGLRETALWVTVVMSACPVGIFSVLGASIYRHDEELAGAALLVTTAIATVAVFGMMLLM